MTDRDRIARVQAETMAVFSRVNPTRREHTIVEAELEGLRRREETILANLGLTPGDFRDRRVLDAGCGTGEIAMLAASWGADVSAFDLNPVSVGHAIRMAERAGVEDRCRFVQGSVLCPPFRGPFDIVMCLGVLAHVGDPRRGYASLARLVKPEGYLYVSHINRFGFALRRSKRAVVHALSMGNPEKKAKWANMIWRRHVERAARFGHRTKDQIAWDNFVAPHIAASIADWLQWMDENNLDYVSSFPSFFRLRLPTSAAGGIEAIAPADTPSSRWAGTFLSLVVQVRWAFAFRLGGVASISFLARKRPDDR